MDRNRSVSCVILILSLSCLGWSYSAAGRNREGVELYRKGEYDGAIAKYSEAMKDEPENPALPFNIAAALYKKGQFQEAAKLYEKSLAARDPLEQAGAFYNIGNCRYRMWKGGADANLLREAAAFYVKSIELNPDDRDAKYNLELAMRELKKMEEKQKEKEQEEKKKEQEEKKGEEGEEEKKEEEKKREEEKEKEGKKEQEKKEDEAAKTGEPTPQPAETKKPDEPQSGKELTREQAEAIIQALEREEREPTRILEMDLTPVPERVEKDW